MVTFIGYKVKLPLQSGVVYYMVSSLFGSAAEKVDYDNECALRNDEAKQKGRLNQEKKIYFLD